MCVPVHIYRRLYEHVAFFIRVEESCFYPEKGSSIFLRNISLYQTTRLYKLTAAILIVTVIGHLDVVPIYYAGVQFCVDEKSE